MKTSLKITTLFVLLTTLWSCNKDVKADAYGNFEATEITVSSQANGQLLNFKIDEGAVVKKQAVVGYVDTIPLFLKKQQLVAQKQIIYSKSKGVLSQISVLKAQLKTAQSNLERTQKLFKDKSATKKQLDAVTGQFSVLNQQIKSIEIQNIAVVNEAKSITAQLNQIEDQISKSFIINPLDGTVLTTYAEQSEVVTFGKPLYKLADLSQLELRVYIGESQLSSLKIGQEVSVKVDSQNGMKTYKGTISWMASEAEFTPKIIQTKEERVNLVYAVKIIVKNDGRLKIGMPAEMWILSPTLSKEKGE